MVPRRQYTHLPSDGAHHQGGVSSHFVFEDEGVLIRPEDQERFHSLSESVSWLYFGIGGVLCAAIGISDPLRPEARNIMEALRREGIAKTVMLTGDNRRVAGSICADLALDDYRAEVLPEDKAAYIRKEHDAGRTVIMVGDGINDTPALSLSDVGVAVGSGAVIAREVADVTIETEDIRELRAWSARLNYTRSQRLPSQLINYTAQYELPYSAFGERKCYNG